VATPWHQRPPYRPAPDPLRQDGDLLRRQFGAGRHLDFAIVAQDLYQHAQFRLSRHNRRTVAAALQKAVPVEEGNVRVLEFELLAKKSKG